MKGGAGKTPFRIMVRTPLPGFSSIYQRINKNQIFIFKSKQSSFDEPNMYQNVQDFNEAEEEKQHPECRHTQPSTSIDIPASSKSKDLFYKQMSPQYQEFYSDILSFTSGNTHT